MAEFIKAVKGEQLNYLVTKVNEKLDEKVDKVAGKGLSTNDFTNELLEKVNGIASGAEVNQNAFSTVVVGENSIVADSKTDSFAIQGSDYVKVSAAGDAVTIEVQNLGSAAYQNTDAFDAKGSAAAVLGTAADDASQNTVFGVKAALSAAVLDTNSAIIGDADDDATDNTIYGAKAHATDKANQALTDAKTYTDTKTAGLTGAMHFEGIKDAVPTDNTGYESGDVIIVNNVEYVFDGSAWFELGAEGSHVLKTQTINGHALSGNIELSYTDVGAEAQGVAQNLINALNHATVGSGDYVSDVAQVNGKVTITKGTLPTVMPNPTALTVKNASGTVTKTYTGSDAVEITAADLGALTEHQDISGKQDNLSWITNEEIDAMFAGTYVPE